jgi:hypothetical protein
MSNNNKSFQTLGNGGHFAHLPWEQLIDNILDILFKDENKLESNTEYYKKMYNSENPDKVQLEKMYQRIQHEQTRLALIRELIARFQTMEIFVIATKLEKAIKTESQTQNKQIENWLFTIRKKDNHFTSYFHPLG